MKADPVLVGECLGGAMYTEDFRRMLYRLGVPDYRVVSSESSTSNPDLERRCGNACFTNDRALLQASQLEDRCEDYGQVAWYQGTLAHAPNRFVLDTITSSAGKPMLVCSNTALLSATRFQKHFRIDGDLSTHYGLFDCGPEPTATVGT